MLITPDFSEVKEFTPIAPGTYSARIVDCEVKDSKAGNQYANWKLELFGSPDVANRVVFHSTPFKGGWVTKLAELYKAAIGQEIDKKKPFDTDMLIGKEVKVTLTEGKDQNGELRKYPDVKSVAAIH
jgi:hypothetical protein